MATSTDTASVNEAMACVADAASMRRKATSMFILEAAVEQANRLNDPDQAAQHQQMLDMARNGS